MAYMDPIFNSVTNTINTTSYDGARWEASLLDIMADQQAEREFRRYFEQQLAREDTTYTVSSASSESDAATNYDRDIPLIPYSTTIGVDDVINSGWTITTTDTTAPNWDNVGDTTGDANWATSTTDVPFPYVVPATATLPFGIEGSGSFGVGRWRTMGETKAADEWSRVDDLLFKKIEKRRTTVSRVDEDDRWEYLL